MSGIGDAAASLSQSEGPMQTDAGRSRLVSPEHEWSLYAGIYTFLWSTLVLVLLGALSRTLVELLNLPPDLGPVLLAAPVPVIGAALWWGVVERRDGYTYLHGGVFGLLTASSNVVFWLLVYSAIWGVSVVVAGGILVVFVLVVVLPTGFLVGLPLMFARRRLTGVS